MKYYCETIPVTLAEKLKEKGMPIEMQPLYAQEAPNARGIVKAGVGLWCPSYAEVFDWLMSERNLAVIIYRMTQNFRIAIRSACSGILRADVWGVAANGKDADWHEAANAAIEKALTLI